MRKTKPEPSRTPELGEALDFLRLIWAVDHGLHRASKRTETELGVTGPQRLVLRIVGRFPGIPAGHLAQLLHVHPSTLRAAQFDPPARRPARRAPVSARSHR
jgi:hypothetical protein